MKRTATARGTSGRIDRDDSVVVEISGSDGIGGRSLDSKNEQNLRNCGDSAEERPLRNVLDRQTQDLRQVPVGGETKPVHQLLLGHWNQVGGDSEDLGAQVMSRDAGSTLDPNGLCGWNTRTRLPIADGALAHAKGNGERSNATSGFNGFVESVHTGRITYRDPTSNTFRVSAISHTVKNPGMAFSDNLRAARLKAGMTQEALALACGWSGQSRIANYESSAASAREPKVSEVPLLAAALGVSIASLFGEALASQSSRPDPAILAETHRFLDKAFGTLGKAFDIESEADLFADVYEWILADERPADQRNLVDFAAWREKRDLHRGAVRNEQNGRATPQAGRTDKRRA